MHSIILEENIFCQSSGLILADLSDHGPIIALQVQLGQWPSFTGMEHGRAVYMAKGLGGEVTGFENW